MIATLMAIRAKVTNSLLARRFIGGAAWGVAAAVGSSGIALVMMMFVARFLGKENYGQFVVVQSTLGMVGVFAGFGLGATAIRYTAELRRRDTGRLGHILALTERTVLLFGSIATVGLVLGAGWMASHMLNSSNLSLALTICAFSVFFSTLDSYQKSVLIGLESMRAFAIGSVIGASAGFPIMVVAAKLYGLNGVACAIVLNTMVQSSVSRFQMVNELKRFAIDRNAKGCSKEWRILRDFAFPGLLSGALISPAHWVCQALLANTPSGYAELAVLGVAMQWFNVVMFLPSVVGRVVLPMLTERVSSNNQTDSKRLLRLSIIANAVIALPMAGLIAALSPWILSLYGQEFENGSFVLTIVVFTAAMLAVHSPVGNMIAAASRMWLGTSMNLGWAAVYIGTAYLALQYGAQGVVAAMGVAYLMHSIWVSLWTRKTVLR